MADNQGFIKGALIICLLPYSCGGDANPSASLMDVWLDHREAGVTIDARPSAGPKDADLEYSFPPESSSAEVFLSRPVKLARDETGLVHVLDSGGNCLYRFASSGEYIGQIGNKGAGPGEFSRPNDLIMSRTRIFVSEIDNYRIQMMDTSGVYKKFIRKYLTQYSMTCDDDNYIYIAPLVYGAESRQVAVMNQEGEIIRAFGKPIVFPKDTTTLNHIYLEKNTNDELFAIYRYLPIIRKYSKAGYLIAEYDLNNIAMTKIGKINLDRNRSTKAKLLRRYILNVVATSIYKDHVFLLCHGMNPIILEYDNEGQQRAVYQINHVGQYVVGDFLVTENDAGNKVFYLLQVFPEARIDVYSERSISSKEAKDEKVVGSLLLGSLLSRSPWPVRFCQHEPVVPYGRM
jgi:hypothetical protein